MIDEFVISDKYMEIKQCINCKLTYREIDNIGRLLCSIHPGLRLCDDNNRVYYSCCGLCFSDENNCRILSSEALGCLNMDHMCIDDNITGNDSLTNNNIVYRLEEIKAFSYKVIPTGLFKYGIAKPLVKSIIYELTDKTVLRKKDNDNIVCRFNIFNEITHNHMILIGKHDHYNDNKYNSTASSLIDHTKNKKINEQGNNMSKVVINLQEIAYTINNSDIALILNELHDQEIKQEHSESKRSHKSSVKIDGWAQIDGDTKNTTTTISRKYKNSNTSFIIIKRIDDKLNINSLYSKLR